jgi:hypothetical protein
MGDSKLNALERLYVLDHEVEKLERKIGRAVRTARARGATWSEVAMYLQITKQSAWEKFGQDDLT